MKVAVAVIFNEEGKVLITRRPLQTAHGGFWEFPGGKLELNEEPAMALQREVEEEVGLEITSSSFLTEITHQYGAKTVHLLVFTIDGFNGEAECRESQLDLRWVAVSELINYQFPEANHKIINLLDK
ncbi:8-oxo-dGTP diphosphatase MutT [Legionella jordanis]|uniref:8-oxo-dGTP diphosphatase n=1 Tax=Legionella jordanis TaxID=456 RepID=A0A0W0VAW7_9GAMM|nr:8-oxo-dGTP diphosphatase MutT [Legionella jordanis]KTD17236.1 Mutator protein MutT [Legionella jordanis]RMX03352.1 8-oxo-dGTP diphosphatase MutT [Legionella jordanis]RMX15830.1 8-oxo-dGTP diphosphatase MutT [Legionella jordanis]VEH12566.1 Mutator protein MutT [Legionella jordanis]HAT8713360.1 8-oxo-dGTP diphosphatase MutT [Legionella jordanis]